MMKHLMVWLMIGLLVFVLLAFGLVAAGFGIHMAFTPQIPVEFSATTRAVIGSFESSYQSKAGGRSVRIHYEINGEKYHESMSVLDDNWQVGDLLEIRYDTRNPASQEWINVSPMRRVIGGSLIFIIGVAVLVFVGWIFRQIKRAG